MAGATPGQGPASLIGQVVGGYRLVSVLGKGATGVVFLGERVAVAERVLERTGRDPVVLPQQAAVKVLILPWQLEDKERQDFRDRFVREAKTVRMLHDPHIVAVLDSGEDTVNNQPYMVMPYMSGGTLAGRLAHGPLPLPEIAELLGQLAAGLDYAHAQGVVHRDIKPANVLLDAQGHAYLSDFSIVRLLTEVSKKLTTTGGVLGTPSYMAPEQFAGSTVGPAADLYSLGVVVYELVTGKMAFEATTLMELIRRQMQDPPEAPRTLRQELPEPAEAAILRALAKQPGARFTDAASFARAFAAGLRGEWTEGLAPGQVYAGSWGAPSGQTPTARVFTSPPTVTAPPQRRRGRGVALAGSGLLALLVIVGLLALLSKGGLMAIIGSPTPTGTTATFTGGAPGQTPTGNATQTVTTGKSTPVATSTSGGVSQPAATPVPPTAVPPSPTPTPAPPTVTPTPAAQEAYTAALPGPGCDSGGANWGNTWATITCEPSVVHLAATANQRSSSWYHGMDYYGNYQSFPEDYQLTVDAANITNGTCVGFWYRGPYLAVVCQTGNCYIERFSGNYPLWNTTVPSTDAYSVRLTLIGPNQTLYINGSEVLGVSDSFSLTTGSNIEITAFPPSSPSTDDLADFSNFTFTPLE